ncbi:putative UPF0481 protein [Iris pallida]|uniref:UPF0481 protein n=1 Tax=Iris pallida TaxID=29817 RepID=A0AAX6IC83_IRIPA|nr:putative UPF0481 protein [Iris pallida]
MDRDDQGEAGAGPAGGGLLPVGPALHLPRPQVPPRGRRESLRPPARLPRPLPPRQAPPPPHGAAQVARPPPGPPPHRPPRRALPRLRPAPRGESPRLLRGHHRLTSNDFVETMVLDGTFILELFRGAAREGFKQLGYCRNDPIFAMRGTMHSIQRDMIMLENQIPLFVLDRLLAVQVGQPDRYGLVARIALRFFAPLMPTDEHLRRSDHASSAEFDPLSDVGLHCLELFRRSLLRTGPEPPPRFWIRRGSHKRKVEVDRRQQQLIHCVSELRDAGFQLRREKTDRFWDIKFKDGVLRIPRLLIHDGTKSLLLNLIAFEQCHMDCGNDITSYAVFMNNLINSDEDVAYLHYHGIIEHWLGDNGEVADLFNRLCLEVVFDINDSYLSGLSEQVNRYYNHKWNTWRASLVHNYFGNPWAIISLVAAVVLLVLTLLQTYYTIYAYYWPNS